MQTSIESRYVREVKLKPGAEPGSLSEATPLRRIKDEFLQVFDQGKGYKTKTEETADSLKVDVSRRSWRLELSARIDANTRYIHGQEEQYTSFMLDGEAAFPGIDKAIAQGEQLTFWLKYIVGALFAVGFVCLAYSGLLEGWSTTTGALAITAGVWFAIGMLVGYLSGRLITAIAKLSESAKIAATTPVAEIEVDWATVQKALDEIVGHYSEPSEV